jgi:hypothetical protein
MVVGDWLQDVDSGGLAQLPWWNVKSQRQQPLVTKSGSVFYKNRLKSRPCAFFFGESRSAFQRLL